MTTGDNNHLHGANIIRFNFTTKPTEGHKENLNLLFELPTVCVRCNKPQGLLATWSAITSQLSATTFILIKVS